MTEPVGNSPRRPDIPNNSHRARDEAQAPVAPVEERAELEQIVTGKVTARKPPWYKRMARTMIADDAGSIGEFVLREALVPAVRNLIRDVIFGATDRALYGSSRNGRRDDRRVGRTEGPVSNIRNRYDRMYEEPRARGLTREQRARHDFQEITLDSRAEAIDVVETLIDQVVKFGNVSVADLYRLVGTTGSYVDRNWGWTDLSTADVRQDRGGWLIDLPAPEPLPR